MYNIFISSAFSPERYQIFTMIRLLLGVNICVGEKKSIEMSCSHLDFEIVIKRYHKSIYNLIYRIFNNRDDASDITQDVFINAYKSYGKFRGSEEAIFPWLCKIAINACNNKFRKINRKNKYEVYSLDEPIGQDDSNINREIPDVSSDPALIIQSKISDEIIQRAINNLPPVYKIVILLRDMEGLSYKEIVDATGFSMDQVKIRINRAREILRRNLSAYI